MRQSKAILIISWMVPPAPSASGLLVGQILEELGSERCTVIGELPAGGETLHDDLLYFDTRALPLRRGLRYHKWLTWYRFVNTCSTIIRRKAFDKILAVFPDEYFASAAVYLGKKHKIPVHLWMHNSYLENRKGAFYLLAVVLQKWMFSHAASIYAISEGLTEFYRQKYPRLNVKLLPHGFKIPHLSGSQPLHLNHSERGGERQFLYTGNINASNLHATRLLFAFIRNNKLGHIHLCSGTSVSYLRSHGLLDPPVVYHGFLSEEAFYDMFAKCHVALLAHGLEGSLSATEYNTILPTRLIALLFSRLPIVALVPKGSFVDNFLKSNACALVMNAEEELANLHSFLRDYDLQQQLVNRAVALAPKYDIKLIADQILHM